MIVSFNRVRHEDRRISPAYFPSEASVDFGWRFFARVQNCRRKIIADLCVAQCLIQLELIT